MKVKGTQFQKRDMKPPGKDEEKAANGGCSPVYSELDAPLPVSVGVELLRAVTHFPGRAGGSRECKETHTAAAAAQSLSHPSSLSCFSLQSLPLWAPHLPLPPQISAAPPRHSHCPPLGVASCFAQLRASAAPASMKARCTFRLSGQQLHSRSG